MSSFIIRSPCKFFSNFLSWGHFILKVQPICTESTPMAKDSMQHFSFQTFEFLSSATFTLLWVHVGLQFEKLGQNFLPSFSAERLRPDMFVFSLSCWL